MSAWQIPPTPELRLHEIGFPAFPPFPISFSLHQSPVYSPSCPPSPFHLFALAFLFRTALSSSSGPLWSLQSSHWCQGNSIYDTCNYTSRCYDSKVLFIRHLFLSLKKACRGPGNNSPAKYLPDKHEVRPYVHSSASSHFMYLCFMFPLQSDENNSQLRAG